MRIVRAGLVVVVALLLLPSTPAIAGDEPKKRAIAGVVQLKGGPPAEQAVRETDQPNSPCSGYGGSSQGGTGFTADIVPGASILVRNENNNKVLAKTTLGPGAVANIVLQPDGAVTFDCNLPFKTKKVPRIQFYSIELGQREGAIFSLDDFKTNHWQIVIQVPDI